MEMDISSDFISSVLFTPDQGGTRSVADSHSTGSSDPSLNNGTIQTSDIQELHLLGLHFEDFDGLQCDQIRAIPATETNNNHFGYTNGPPTFDSQGFNCNTVYDTKEVSWPTSGNTDGAIYSFEIVNDNTSTSPFWEDDNLSPITALNHSPYRGSNFISSIDHDDSSRGGVGDKDMSKSDIYRQNGSKLNDKFESNNVLLRNALLGKTNSRYGGDKSGKSKEAADTIKHNTSSSTVDFQTAFSNASSGVIVKPSQHDDPFRNITIVNSKEEPSSGPATTTTTLLPSLINHRTDHLDSSSAATVLFNAAELSDSTGSPHIDEILLSDFDTFPYSDEQLAGICNQDIAQAFQQIYNAEPNFMPYVSSTNTSTAVISTTTSGGDSPSATGVTQQSSIAAGTVASSATAPGDLHHNQIPPSKIRRTSKKSAATKAKLNANSHSSSNANHSEISLSKVDFNCSVAGDGRLSLDSTTNGNCTSSNSSTCSSTTNTVATNGTSNVTNRNASIVAGKGDGSATNHHHQNHTAASTTTVANTNGCSGSSTALGIRKERSLHHCFVCNKGFKDKYSVNVHIRTHTGEKPFSCTVCGKRFRQKAHLAKHQHTHFQKKPLPPSPTNVMPSSNQQQTVIKVTATTSVLEPR